MPKQALSGIVYEVKGRPVDAVLFLNRLDDFRVDASTVQVPQPIPISFQHCVTVLTGNVSAPVTGQR